MTVVVAVGEALVELVEDGDHLRRDVGGDTFNMAVYLARTGAAHVRYASALGDDRLSDGIVELAQREGVDVSLIQRRSGAVPGLYLVQLDPTGERSFLYWRDRSPARGLLDGDIDVLRSAILGADWLMYSGVSLAILSADGRARLQALVHEARVAGTRVLFDPNHRASLWPDSASARAAVEEASTSADVVIASVEDGRSLFDTRSAQATLDVLVGLGCPEVVVTAGGEAALVSAEGHVDAVAPPRVAVIDSTAAGDAFDAAYLAARIAGRSAPVAAGEGHALAGWVVGHLGALAPPY